MDKFWMIKGNGPASQRHATFQEAVTESRRLAEQYPGQEFAVLEAMVFAVAPRPPRPLAQLSAVNSIPPGNLV